MRDPRFGGEGLLRRITGEADARGTLARVANELRRRHDDAPARRRRQRAARVAESSARRGARRGGGGGITLAH
jgi:hypothetical protein